jgi:hypothetical protein
MIYAQRLIAGRCLYGVDKNPLAAEMGKLSLWLLTLQKDKPFTFLDHAIRSGDSLVGIANTHQLTSFSLDGNGPDMPMFTDAIKKRLDTVRILRRQIAEHPDFCVEDVERKGLMLKNAEEQTKRLVYAANHLLAASWEGGSEDDMEMRLKKALTHVEYNFKDLPVEQLEAEGKQRLHEAGCSQPFHWPLEFPEVFMQRGGFDGIVGNPPFMGGQLITNTLGANCRRYLIDWVASGKRGSADLCTYFVLRATSLLRPSGSAGLITTTTISEGETRVVGLDQLPDRRVTLRSAYSNIPWPGTISLRISVLWITNGSWNGVVLLDSQAVSQITSDLSASGSSPFKPFRLPNNRGAAFKGTSVQGSGFILTVDEAKQLIERDSRYADVLYPYLVGQDITTQPDGQASRWIINFFDWSLEKAEQYPLCLAIVRERVKPLREKAGGRNTIGERRAKLWWRYDAQAKDLYNAVEGLSSVWVAAKTSKYVAIVEQPRGIVYSSETIVFPTNSFSFLAIANSTIHSLWVEHFSSTLNTTLRYTVADAFDTYPFPECDFLATIVGQSRANTDKDGPLPMIGMLHYRHRSEIMLARQEGLTKTYNRFHDRGETAEDIQTLRTLYAELDNAVAAVYGWADLDLAHGFHENKQGLRFTISEPARCEVLARLLKLNHERYAEEVAQGLHDKKGKKSGAAKKTPKYTRDSGPTLF